MKECKDYVNLGAENPWIAMGHSEQGVIKRMQRMHEEIKNLGKSESRSVADYERQIIKNKCQEIKEMLDEMHRDK